MGYQKRKNGERYDSADVQKNLGNRRGTPNWQGFISCELTTEDKTALRETETLWSDDAIKELEASLIQGYKVGMSFNQEQETFTVSLTDNDPNSEFGGYCLTGRGSSLENAFNALMYKHLVRLKDGWKNVAVKRDEYS